MKLCCILKKNAQYLLARPFSELDRIGFVVRVDTGLIDLSIELRLLPGQRTRIYIWGIVFDQPPKRTKFCWSTWRQRGIMFFTGQFHTEDVRDQGYNQSEEKKKSSYYKVIPCRIFLILRVLDPIVEPETLHNMRNMKWDFH